ncbi:cell division protein ZapE [Microbacterium sp. MM2322]|uniref:cell division protein ZapE n=1 Tax=Microbacterium sp. MM2322 TaxID=3157631 RepID=UPI0032D57ED9
MRKDELVRAVEAAASADGFALDIAQRAVLDRLSALGSETDSSRSVYIYGEAGRGKSWLADAVYTALPLREKTRVHFHGFFRELHGSIQNHRSEPDAVERAIDDITGNSTVLFFDELHVHDPGDARLLTRLLDHVFARRVTVVATSNYAPDDLLPDPDWHHIFEPGIALITANMDVLPLRGPTDYRTVNDTHTHGFASGTWSTRTPPRTTSAPRSLTLNGRVFPVTSTDDGELTVTFDQLCRTPTSTMEYLRWARDFTRWTVTGVPHFDDAGYAAQQRFINLIDVLVAENVPVDFFADVDIDDFLDAASQRPDAFRMASRLRLLETAVAPELGPGT